MGMCEKGHSGELQGLNGTMYRPLGPLRVSGDQACPQVLQAPIPAVLLGGGFGETCALASAAKEGSMRLPCLPEERVGSERESDRVGKCKLGKLAETKTGCVVEFGRNIDRRRCCGTIASRKVCAAIEHRQ